MQKQDVKVGDVVMVAWYSGGNIHVPALVYGHNEAVGDVVFVAPGGIWGKDWLPYNQMRKADAKTQASMKLIMGRKRSHDFGAFRYMVACAAPLGARDTIIAGCRKWATFAEAFAYYERMRQQSYQYENSAFYRGKADASADILEHLQAKYAKALAQQRRAVYNYQKKRGGI